MKIKNEKGITLIALIITIIVMLILVGVSVSVALNGGLFNTAEEATGRTKNAVIAEQKLDNGSIKIGEEEVTFESIDDYINAISTEIPEELITYILGTDREGKTHRNIYSRSAYVDDTNTPDIDESQSITYVTSYTDNYNNIYYIIRYNDSYYKYRVKGGKTTPIDSIEAIKNITKPNNLHVGETVMLNGVQYKVLYGEGEKTSGAQLVAVNTAGSIKLGVGDLTVPSTIKKFEKNNTDDLSLEKAVYSYNHAIETLNQACYEAVLPSGTSSEVTSIVDDVRSIGSNPRNKNEVIRPDGSTEFYNEGMIPTSPSSSGNYSTGILVDKLVYFDDNYVSDYERLNVIGGFDMDTFYASRMASGGSVGVRQNNQIITAATAVVEGKTVEKGIRPVVILKPGALATLLP